MRVAEILSDLTSLRACDPSAALALVSTRPSPSSVLPSKNSSIEAPEHAEGGNGDLRRAKELAELHAALKGAQRKELVGPVREEAERVGRRALGVAQR
ncbi:hypothetical protein P152DRAFT_483246 [Eremomyces bilateralis CBS 781.70]|uniref:Uncharacterized protein n=1 Tax=Eremomyces bilateralis CBS 781.70 TaxID=1392243 RepID=A0A6G1FZZ4_9PEZI|nr:uncharacterized protein P152DRAFT_483246 [Eremomyces bilateralis CBS 781.70]KAF1811374.1 hypothetical protein P152DRAFT_483246 [Eremomyces bilateralis CBS 781.70]